MAATPKKSFVLRLDESTYKALERWAVDEFRSVNGQMEWLLAKALKEHGRIKGKDEEQLPPADRDPAPDE